MGATAAAREPTDAEVWAMSDADLDVYEAATFDRRLGQALAGELTVRLLGALRSMQEQG